MKFAEFYVGQQIEAGPYEVLENEIIDFAKRYDPQWFHTDPAAAASGPFEGLIASGWHSCGIAMRLVAENVLQVLDVRRSDSRPELGILQWRWQLYNQDDIEVLDLEATSMFKLDTEKTA